jgi:drug/metabolite transporter (DMT)-like permease
MIEAARCWDVVHVMDYVIVASASTLLTKTMVEKYAFTFPISMSLLQTLTTFSWIVALFGAGISKYKPLPSKHFVVVGTLSILTAATVGLQNIGVMHLSLPLQQLFKGVLPFPVVVLEILIEGKTHTWTSLLAVTGLVGPLPNPNPSPNPKITRF